MCIRDSNYPFALASGADIKKTPLTISDLNFSVAATPSSTKDYFIAISNPQKTVTVYSNSTGKGKISTISPSGTTKTDMSSLTGDFQLP
jgi:hypothetical protein